MSNVNFSAVQPTGNQVQDMQSLFDAYARLRKELVHGLSFLDEENVPVLKTIKGDIEGAYTAIQQTDEAVSLLAVDVSENSAELVVQSNQISAIVSDVEGNTSSITVLSDEITLKVDANGVIAAINLSPETIDISASKINLVGAVTVLSDITGALGTITAGTVNSVTINGSTFNVGAGDGKITIGAAGSDGYLVFGSNAFNIWSDTNFIKIGKYGTQSQSPGIIISSFSNDIQMLGPVSFDQTPDINGSNIATYSQASSLADSAYADAVTVSIDYTQDYAVKDHSTQGISLQYLSGNNTMEVRINGVYVGAMAVA